MTGILSQGHSFLVGKDKFATWYGPRTQSEVSTWLKLRSSGSGQCLDGWPPGNHGGRNAGYKTKLTGPTYKGRTVTAHVKDCT